MRKSEKPVEENNTSLDFPDWSGMDDSGTRITPEAAFRLCEQYPLMFPNSARIRRDEPRCQVEFCL